MVAQLRHFALAVLTVYCDLQPYWLLALIQLPDVVAVELKLNWYHRRNLVIIILMSINSYRQQQHYLAAVAIILTLTQ
jgi:hypothetical protein